MKISKHVHSCLLVEDQGKTVLIDPGNYSYEEKALGINSLSKLDLILVTHEHPDHLHLPFVKELLEKFPGTPIITNSSIVEILRKESIEASTEGNDFVRVEDAPHEHVFGVPKMPKNVLFRVFGKLTHPGDSEQYKSTTDILSLPVLAPWTSTTKAVEGAVRLKPKVVIPIHDWHWNNTARGWFYNRFNDYFRQNGIEFRGLQTGEVIEI